MIHRAQKEKTNIRISSGKGKSEPRCRFTVRSMFGEKVAKGRCVSVFINSFCISKRYIPEQVLANGNLNTRSYDDGKVQNRREISFPPYSVGKVHLSL